jgi:hypothetical protein
VNIEGLAGLGGGGTGHIHVLVDDAGAARSALEGAGYSVEAQRDAVVIELSGEDKPGKLGELAGKVADAGVNLAACYVAAGSRLVFVAEDSAALRSALGV